MRQLGRGKTQVQLYTANSAQFNWEDHRRGTIQPQRLADLVAYRTDPITCPVDQLLSLRPVFTMVGGGVVYDPETIFCARRSNGFSYS